MGRQVREAPIESKKNQQVFRTRRVIVQDDLAKETSELTNLPRGRIREAARRFYNRFVRLRGSPEQIAWGAAVGIFVAMTPTMGIQTLIAVFIAAFFRINKVAAAATVWLTNPFTAPFIYGFNYLIGAKLLGYPLNAPFFTNPSWQTLWHSSRSVILSLTVGGTLSGIVVGVAGYLLSLRMVRVARKKARKLKQRKKH